MTSNSLNGFPLRPQHLNGIKYGLMINPLKLLFGVLIVFVVLITPLFSFNELIALIYGGIESNSIALTSPFLKGIKDFALLVIIMVGILSIVDSQEVSTLSLSLASIIIFLSIVSIIFSFDTDLLAKIAGVRWLLPLLIPFLIYKLVDCHLLRKVNLVLMGMLCLHLGLQLIQLYFSYGWFKFDVEGWSLRNPGIFLY